MGALSVALGVAAAIAVALAISPAPASAQALWLDRMAPRAILFEVLRPVPGTEVGLLDELRGLSGVIFLTGRTEFSPSAHGVAEISFATSHLEEGFSSEEAGALLGSPYLGVEYGTMQSLALLEAGIRIPIAVSAVITTDLALGADLERQSAWYDDAITTRIGARLRTRPKSELGLWLEARLAPEFVYDLDRTEFDLHATYGATARITRSWLRGGVGIGGRAIFEPPDDDDTIEAAHVVEAAADFLGGKLRPGLSLRLPFDGNFGETYDSTVGLHVTYVL